MKTFPSVIFIALANLLLWPGCSKNEMVNMAGQTMGTTYHIKIAEPGITQKTLTKWHNQVDSVLREINRQMSTYQPQSEISQFNTWPAGRPFHVSPDFMNVLRLSLRIYRESDGAFDVTVGPLVDLWGFGKEGKRSTPPGADEIKKALAKVGSDHVRIAGDSLIVKEVPGLQLDFSAVAKGYGVDAVAALLSRNKIQNYMVEIGGEVLVRGTKFGKHWRIGIDRPSPGLAPGQQLDAILQLTDKTMATSGDYRNFFTFHDTLFSHEINPKTGKPVHNGVASVTILAPSCALADAMATAIMVMGEKRGMEWVESKPEVEALIIKRQDNSFKEIFSSGFKRYLAQ